MLAAGYTRHAVEHGIRRGRLHPVWPGAYAVGRSDLTRYGRWMAAVLSCGPEAAVSHTDAGALWELLRPRGGRIEVSVPARVVIRRRGIVAHRRTGLTAQDVTRHHGIPVTSVICTIVDLAPRLERGQLEAVINEADKRGLANPERLRKALDGMPGRPGVRIVRSLLDRHTFRLTDSELERLFLPIARTAGLSTPLTQQWVNGFKVDFYCPDLGLVVETDGGRFHRTGAQQTRDRRRDQAHTVAGMTPLRFTHAQVKFEPDHVRATLAVVARRLQSDSSAAASTSSSTSSR